MVQYKVSSPLAEGWSDDDKAEQAETLWTQNQDKALSLWSSAESIHLLLVP
jgi:hypothetical protein